MAIKSEPRAASAARTHHPPASAPPLPVADRSAEIEPDFRVRRERLFASLFGEPGLVYTDSGSRHPSLTVHLFKPNPLREYHTYLTSGMSDLAMAAPGKFGKEVRRTELVFYAREDRPEYALLLMQLAGYPLDQESWLHWGHTMAGSEPPAPLLNSTELDSLLFMPTVLRPDADLGELLTWHGEAVNLLWVVPISAAECALKLEQGAEALYELFEKHKHPIAFDAGRKSYV